MNPFFFIRRTVAAAMFAVVLLPFPPVSAVEQANIEYTPTLAPKSNEGLKRIQTFKFSNPLEMELVAAEPDLANPVCFYVDNKGRIYVAETFRHSRGVTDMRGHVPWLEDDLASRTVEDRLVAMKKNLGEKFSSYSVEHDRVRLLEDTDGDGKIDRSTVFADGFNDALAGIGSGLLEERGEVYYACIPELWKLRDGDGDGRAEDRELMSSGYGVHISLLGHDSHGLRKGPDGKIYFSVGDRGFNVKTREGETLSYPDTGAVLRCDPDGANLEVIHSGLRNPQELVFDDFGNLFTGDNNSDSGDLARWVQIVEGGNSGWLISYQWKPYPMARGSWNAEKLWHLEHEGQAAFILPPLAHITSGPSGLAYHPGTGFPERYKGYFFLCDFRGNSTRSLIHAFTLKPKGASFELVDRQEIVTGVLATDVDFGPGPGLYISDWSEGWEAVGKGRIYRLFDASLENDPVVVETEKLLGEGFSHRPTDELLGLLGHANQRVRLESQWALADRDEEAVEPLFAVAETSDHRLARLHAIWGLGQVGRTAPVSTERLVALLADEDAEVRAQCAKILGDLRGETAVDALIAALKDESARVRFLAAPALGKLGDARAFGPILDLIRENDDVDKYLRHAGVMGLVGVASEEELAALASDSSKAARMGGLLALRKIESAEIERFLRDEDLFIQIEAARAINDVPISEAIPTLADEIASLPPADLATHETHQPFVRRVLNANYILGGPDRAKALAVFAADDTRDTMNRREALTMLTEWSDPPSGLSRVLGVWRPIAKRETESAKNALIGVLPKLLGSAPALVREKAAIAIAAYRLSRFENSLLDLVRDKETDLTVRVAALRSLGETDSKLLEEAVDLARTSEKEQLRGEALDQLGRIDPNKALSVLGPVLENGSNGEKRKAFAVLGRLDLPKAGALLDQWLDRLANGGVPLEAELELLEAARSSRAKSVREKMAAYEAGLADQPLSRKSRFALAGGDPERGKNVFFKKAEVSCQRCHVVHGEGGGEAGPELTGVASRQTPEYLLESILDPNLEIAEGFENVTLTLDDGAEFMGRVVKETEEGLELEVNSEALDFFEDEAIPHSAAGGEEEAADSPFEIIDIGIDEIVDRKRNLSAMPEKISDLLTPYELRDLMAFLLTLGE